jgi:hypothetical protein
MILHYEVRLVMSNSTWDLSLDHHACDVMFVWLGGDGQGVLKTCR